MADIKKITVKLKDIRLYAYHGVTPQEKQTGCWFQVSCSLVYPAIQAALTDDLAHTVDYSKVVEIISREMAVTSNLIEHVAARIIDALLAGFPLISEGWVKVAKLDPPVAVPTESASVTLKF